MAGARAARGRRPAVVVWATPAGRRRVGGLRAIVVEVAIHGRGATSPRESRGVRWDAARPRRKRQLQGRRRCRRGVVVARDAPERVSATLRAVRQEPELHAPVGGDGRVSGLWKRPACKNFGYRLRSSRGFFVISASPPKRRWYDVYSRSSDRTPQPLHSMQLTCTRKRSRTARWVHDS